MTTQGLPSNPDRWRPIVAVDDGYKAICPNCMARHAASRKDIGRQRELRLVECAKCLRSYDVNLERRNRINGILKGQ